MYCSITPERSCKLSSFIMKITSRRHSLLANVVKEYPKIDGMGPFKNKIIKFISKDFMTEECHWDGSLFCVL